MVKKRAVILPSYRAKTFDWLSLPDGSRALVIDREEYEKALAAVDRKISESRKLSLKNGIGQDEPGFRFQL